MSEPTEDEDKLEVERAKEAVHTAQVAAVQVDAAVAAIHRSSREINAIAERNGYVDRFRRMIRGVA